MLEVISEQRVVLDPCSWDTYQRILDEQREQSSPRFTFDSGVLEIMSPSSEHERANEAIKLIVYVACEEMGLEVEGLGSTTQKIAHLQKGVEPDSSFYFDNLERDPSQVPPDLVVEVEISRSALSKLPIFASLGIQEVWRYDGRRLTILVLDNNAYQESATSKFLPLSAQILTDLLVQRPNQKRTAWVRKLRTIVQAGL